MATYINVCVCIECLIVCNVFQYFAHLTANSIKANKSEHNIKKHTHTTNKVFVLLSIDERVTVSLPIDQKLRCIAVAVPLILKKKNEEETNKNI